MDVHSYSRPEQARVRHLELDLNVNFQQKTLEGLATLHFDLYSGNELILEAVLVQDELIGLPTGQHLGNERRQVTVGDEPAEL